MTTDNADVIDISHHQASVDFAKVKASGVVGVILKATEGSTIRDKTYADRKKAALDAGLPVASYHFMRPGNIDQQMAHFLTTVKPIKGERVILDHEDDKVPLSDLVKMTQILMADPADLQVTIYSGHLIKQQLGNKHDDVLALTSLWLAQYTTGEPSWPTGTWPHWTLWQYSDSGQVPGVGPGSCDRNHFNGSKENCIRWMTPASQLDPGSSPPAAAVEGDTMTIAIDTTANIGKVVLKINGVIQQV